MPKQKFKYLRKMLRLKKIKFIKYSLFLILIFFWSCCKVGYTYITISNSSGTDKLYKAYAILKNNNQYLGQKVLNELNTNGEDEFIINGYDSDELKEFEEEKRIVIVLFDSKKGKNGKEIKSVNDSIIKSYSMKELENNNWEITISEN
jgi:hypothetical protein